MKRLELVQKLELVGRALATHDLVPIFKCFVFTGDTVYAYSDSIGIVAPCKMPGIFAVDGDTLLGLLQHSSSEEVEFAIVDKELRIKAGKSIFKLPYQTKEQFLFEEPARGTTALHVPEEFFLGLKASLETTSKDTAQPALMGVWMKGHTLYSCDGDALTKFVVYEKQSNDDYLMPNQFCEAVVKISDEPDITDVLFFTEGWAVAEIRDYVIYGRLIENDNPLDHEELIKKTVKSELQYVTIPQGLDDALSRARVVADAESAKTTLTVEGGKLTILTDTHTGVVRDVLPFKHPNVEATISAELMQRSIALCEEVAILDNCCCFRAGEQLFVLLSNRT